MVCVCVGKQPPRWAAQGPCQLAQEGWERAFQTEWEQDVGRPAREQQGRARGCRRKGPGWGLRPGCAPFPVPPRSSAFSSHTSRCCRLQL